MKMQFRPAAGGTIVIFVVLSFLSCSTEAHNITRILAKFPNCGKFNQYLTQTHLAEQINSRQTITVLAVNDAAMTDFLAKRLPISAITNVLSLHVLLDYFGEDKLKQITDGTALIATLYQATGSALAASGLLNITDLKGGRVGFGAVANGGTLDAEFVKSLEEIPYNISVVQISKILSLPEAEAPSPSPSQMNFTDLMSSHGCKLFAETLLASGAEKTFVGHIDSGLTVFCPIDAAVKSFVPKYNNLTADGKQSLLEYHGLSDYNSLAMLRSNNGVMNTLATDGARKYALTVQNDDQTVILKTKIVTAKITGTVIDKQPLAIYTVDKVLLPPELFKAEPAPAPAPVPASPPAPEVDPKAPKAAPTPPDFSPSDSPDDSASDQPADGSGAVRFNGAGVFSTVLISMCLGLSLL